MVLCCLAGLYKEHWFLNQTSKGEWLVRKFGETGAVWVLRALFIGGALLGGLLAAGVIHPLQWE